MMRHTIRTVDGLEQEVANTIEYRKAWLSGQGPYRREGAMRHIIRFTRDALAGIFFSAAIASLVALCFLLDIRLEERRDEPAAPNA